MRIGARPLEIDKLLLVIELEQLRSIGISKQDFSTNNSLTLSLA